jgi:hypothetical protein
LEINACKVLVGKSERERQLGRPRRRGEDNVRMDLRENRCEVEFSWIRVDTSGRLL